jgi:hypothetical protein
MTDEQLYAEKAGLHPEFSRIVCAAFGIIKGDGLGQVVAQAGNDEKLILNKSMDMIGRFAATVYKKNKTAGARLCGHNIKRFDVPMLLKRSVIHGLEIPNILAIQEKKPWEMPFVDTAELWSFGAWQESFTSLDLISNVMGLESPKTDMHGDMVNGLFWNSGSPAYADSIADIKRYCQNDVLTTMSMLLKWSHLTPIPLSTAERH